MARYEGPRGVLHSLVDREEPSPLIRVPDGYRAYPIRPSLFARVWAGIRRKRPYWFVIVPYDPTEALQAFLQGFAAGGEIGDED